MCKIRLLIIGESESRNSKTAEWVEDQCTIAGDDVKVICKIVKPLPTFKLDTSEYDLAAVDNDVIFKGCSRSVLGSGLPVITFNDINNGSCFKNETQNVISGAITSAIDSSRLREHIYETTQRIRAARQSMAKVACIL